MECFGVYYQITVQRLKLSTVRGAFYNQIHKVMSGFDGVAVRVM